MRIRKLGTGCSRHAFSSSGEITAVVEIRVVELYPPSFHRRSDSGEDVKTFHWIRREQISEIAGAPWSGQASSGGMDSDAPSPKDDFSDVDSISLNLTLKDLIPRESDSSIAA